MMSRNALFLLVILSLAIAAPANATVRARCLEHRTFIYTDSNGRHHAHRYYGKATFLLTGNALLVHNDADYFRKTLESAATYRRLSEEQARSRSFDNLTAAGFSVFMAPGLAPNSNLYVVVPDSLESLSGSSFDAYRGSNPVYDTFEENNSLVPLRCQVMP